MEKFDIAVIGAGAAGMMCAAVAAQLGRRVVLLDHAEKIGEKIRISGGGRCNFTNVNAGPANYLSENPHFCRSALARYTPRHFLDLLARYRVGWHEKHRGQLFCDDSSEAIIDVLKGECLIGNVEWRHPVTIHDVLQGGASRVSSHSATSGGHPGFTLLTSAGEMAVNAVIVATGGLSIPKIGASGFAFALAEKWGIPLIKPQPALVPLTFAATEWAPYAELAGISMEVGVKISAASGAIALGKAQTAGDDVADKLLHFAGKTKNRMERNGTGSRRGGQRSPVEGAFVEDLLLTHRGLSGPAILQISSYWTAPAALEIDLLPGHDATAALLAAKAGSRKQLSNLLAEWLPIRLAAVWAATAGVPADARLADLPDKTLRALGAALNAWRLQPAGSEGWRKAEVTRGGVDTNALSSATMQAHACPGLYFIGEAVDVTGWLGGYNFQWAWASAVAAGQAAAEATRT
jgi:predicted flavoprotein YhiN